MPESTHVLDVPQHVIVLLDLQFLDLIKCSHISCSIVHLLVRGRKRVVDVVVVRSVTHTFIILQSSLILDRHPIFPLALNRWASDRRNTCTGRVIVVREDALRPTPMAYPSSIVETERLVFCVVRMIITTQRAAEPLIVTTPCRPVIVS